MRHIMMTCRRRLAARLLPLVLLGAFAVETGAQVTVPTTTGEVTVRLRKRPGATDADLGWFGFAIACKHCATAAEARGESAAIVRRVFIPGPAHRASLAVGDTLIAVDGRAVNAAQLDTALTAVRTGHSLRLLVGGAGGRRTVTLTKEAIPLHLIGGDSLPVRYQGSFAGTSVDVLTHATPVVSRDSSGAMIIRVGEHVVRLTETRRTAIAPSRAR